MSRPDASRSVFWWSWGVLWVLAATWAVANPLMASPDEPAHVVRAASLVRGQVLEPDGDWGTAVEVPYFYQLVNAYPTCYMFQPEKGGACEVAAERPLTDVVDSGTKAGRYNPLYYAVVGLPTLLAPGDTVLYLMRLVSAALCTFFVALGLRSIARTPAPAWAVLGAAGAITPMVVFLSSSVNPAGVEIAAAFALWCQLLTLLRYPVASRVPARMAGIALSTTVLVNARGLSLLYTAVIVGVVLLVSPWREVREVFRTRRAWPSFAVIGVAGVAAAAWVLVSNSLGATGELARPDLTFLSAAKTTLLSTGTYLTNMVGQFGWTDTNLEPAVLMAFAAAGGLVLLLGIVVADGRERWTLAGLAIMTVALPVLIHAMQARHLGIIWQGRYILPIAVGLPLVAGYLLMAHATRPDPARLDPARLGPPGLAAGQDAGSTATAPIDLGRVGRNLATVVAVIVAAVQLAAFAQNLHRYVNGADGVWASIEPGAWLPPVPIGLVLLVALVASVGYGVVLVVLARAVGPTDTATAPDDTATDDTAPDDTATDDAPPTSDATAPAERGAST